MTEICRGTTPTLIFRFPFECFKISACSIAFAQPKTAYDKDPVLVLEKRLDACSADGNCLTLEMTEEDALKLDCHYPLEIQLRIKCGEKKMASSIIRADVGRILKDGCL